MYRVNDIFYSLQGEGVRVGEPSVFVRFSGCNLKCSRAVEGFDCDTEFVSGRSMDLVEILSAVTEAGGDCRWVVLTGGEPGLQVDDCLVQAFHEAGYKLAIETNGTQGLPNGIDWVAVSPKTAEHTLKVKRADEVKYVRGLGQGIPKPSIKADHYLISPAFHPDGLYPEVLGWCVRLCKLNPEWRLSLQAHKIWGRVTP